MKTISKKEALSILAGRPVTEQEASKKMKKVAREIEAENPRAKSPGPGPILK
jgi:hypothetical protein